MSNSELQIKLFPESLDEGPAYERAAFGQLVISAGDQLLTALVETDGDSHTYARGPYTSGYHLAEWLAWNWWRLRWEPRSSPLRPPAFEWDIAHRMSDVGEGYRWPNITFSCDGFQCELTSQRSHEAEASDFSYIGAQPVSIPAMEFERAVDDFVAFILCRLQDAGIPDTNLHAAWDDLADERTDPDRARSRRIEALLGFEPDQADDQQIEQCLRDSDILGSNALDEITTGAANNILSACQIKSVTSSAGFDMNTNDAIRLDCPPDMEWGQIAAWRVGVAAARSLRTKVGLPDLPIASPYLADMAGTSVDTIKENQCTNSMSWMLHQSDKQLRVALRQSRKTARRFDLARLIGDRLFSESTFIPSEALSPATRSYSYRQKAQRAFAAELLSPWEAVRSMLEDDHSQENQEQVADYFGVSPLTISTLLMNNEGYSGGIFFNEATPS